MKKQTHYKLINLLPAYDVDGWMTTYKEFYVATIRNPEFKKDTRFMEQVLMVKNFLKSKGYKFI